jgi:hypothetical protein
MDKTELQELFPGDVKVTLPNSDKEFVVREVRMQNLDDAISFLGPYQTAMSEAMALAKEQGVELTTVSHAQVLYDVIIKHRSEAMSFCAAVSNASTDELQKLSVTQLMMLLGAGVGVNAGFFLNVIVRTVVRPQASSASSPRSFETVTSTEKSAVTQ